MLKTWEMRHSIWLGSPRVLKFFFFFFLKPVLLVDVSCFCFEDVILRGC